ncbi:ribose 5-phosphate isomerase B [Lagierella massiliensis]|uniref:ribose 5-phosphate isomerase B n=1 Tax=Lagierella massiliensis TaxID=1689303 RepID=UPI0006D856CC|nr:ribose 5-phosphate isomerase B [Lagierella massiliensis]
MRIAMGSDHGGAELRIELIEYIKELGHDVTDFGVELGEKADYPNIGIEVAKEVANGNFDCGIILCGTGIGISIAANKVKGIRCAVTNEVYSAKMAKIHNNANIISLGGRVVGLEVAKMIVSEYLNAEYEGGRHENRLKIISDYEENL